jgi:ATP-dependent Clp protease ATP-binding subunit ClpC
VYPFERFSEDAKMVLTLAQEEAERSHHSYIGTEHLLLALIRQDGVGGRTLLALGLTAADLRTRIAAVLGGKERIVIQQMIPTSRVKRVIEIAFEEARRQESHQVGTDHLLLALMIEGEGIAARVLGDRGITVGSLRAEIQRQREGGPAEESSPPPKEQRKHRHLVLTDGQGRTIGIEASFSGYSEEECDAVEALLKQTLTS